MRNLNSFARMQLILGSILLLQMNGYTQNKNWGIFENYLDLANNQIKGFVSYDPLDQKYLFDGSGYDISSGAEGFPFLWKSIQGDFIARAEVEFAPKSKDSHSQFGWLVSNTLDKSAPMVQAAIQEDGTPCLVYRKTQKGATKQVESEDKKPDVIQLMRKGTTYTLSAGKFGEDLASISIHVALKNEVKLGIYVKVKDSKKDRLVTFRNVRIVKLPSESHQAYKDYLGSKLEVLDIHTGNRKVLMNSAHSIQAPNWTPDGKRLIYNSNGFLYNYWWEDGRVSLLNTGFANRNNNDHVLSFDGKTLAISHHNEADEGASSLYILSAEGSDYPKKVTKDGVGASYLHGWSTDHKDLVFTGKRKGQYDIFSVNIETGVETQLTDQKSLDDGPEYSPDGKYIYFCSTRTGRMKIWRMKPDGREKEQLTFGKSSNDWFPHISPDNKWIVYISYTEEVEADSHPFYKEVTLRLLPVSGGEPKIIAYLFGGQGTINVPSWSPDSKKIAFVSNTNF